MTTYTRNTLSGSLAPVNNELEKIEVSLREKLDRNPSVAQSNEMLDDLDMNSNRIINYPDAVNDSDLITKGQVASLAPVQSVDGQTGNVVSPVQTVNGQTGNVSIPTQIQIDNGVVFDNISEMKSSSLEVGQLVRCKRYYNGGELVEGLVYEIQATQAVDGYGDHALSNGNVAILIISVSLSADAFGMSTSNTSNDGVLNAIVNRLKLGGCNTVKFSSGTYNFQCFDELTRGRAAVEIRGLSSVEFVGERGTVFKAVVGGFGTDPFALIRLDENSKNITFRGIEFNGDCSNVPEFQPQLGNRSGGILVATWDLTSASQDSYADFSIDNIKIDGCRFINIGGGITTQRKSSNTTRGGYSTAIVTNNVFIDAQISNNTISGDYLYGWKITHNTLTTTLPLSDTSWGIAIDCSRGGVGNEVAYNTVSKYQLGIKAEYFLEGGLLANEIELSEITEIHHNLLFDMGHPTIDVLAGPSGSGSYGIRMSGTNIVERENTITGLFNAANVGSERRLVFGVWSNQTGVTGTRQRSIGGQTSSCVIAVNHNSSDASNEFICSDKKIRDSDKGIVLQAGGSAIDNNIKRIENIGITLQIADQTFVKGNYLADIMQAGGAQAAIFGEQTGANVAYKYWEIIDNEISNVDSGSGTAVIVTGGSAYTKDYIYKRGRYTSVGALENFELVSSITDDTQIKAKGLGNPSSLAVINAKNIASFTAIDANTFQINFKRALPNSSFTFDAREPNNPAVFWINFGTDPTYLRLRSVDSTGTPVALPSTIMFSVV